MCLNSKNWLVRLWSGFFSIKWKQYVFMHFMNYYCFFCFHYRWYAHKYQSHKICTIHWACYRKQCTVKRNVCGFRWSYSWFFYANWMSIATFKCSLSLWKMSGMITKHVVVNLSNSSSQTKVNWSVWIGAGYFIPICWSFGSIGTSWNSEKCVANEQISLKCALHSILLYELRYERD